MPAEQSEQLEEEGEEEGGEAVMSCLAELPLELLLLLRYTLIHG